MSDRLETSEIETLAAKCEEFHGYDGNKQVADLMGEAAEALRELSFQRGWWESNYGNNTMFAPSRKLNNIFMDALRETTPREVPDPDSQTTITLDTQRLREEVVRWRTYGYSNEEILNGLRTNRPNMTSIATPEQIATLISEVEAGNL